MDYQEQLKRPEWQRLRLKTMERDDWKCRKCGDDKTTLHVHHLRYAPNKLAWEYEPSDLVTLCEPCHLLGHRDALIEKMRAATTENERHEIAAASVEMMCKLPPVLRADLCAKMAKAADGSRGVFVSNIRISGGDDKIKSLF